MKPPTSPLRSISSRSRSTQHRRSSPLSSPRVKHEPSPSPPLRSISPEPTGSSHPAPPAPTTDPREINYRLHPESYRILRGEMNVFKTQPYSNELKALWRFKDEAVARRSAEELWRRFEEYRDQRDFVGMDVTRKFIQMGRTRSLRYALRPGGRKYDKTTRVEIPRTGKVADEGKLKGAQVFEAFLKRVEEDASYREAKERWKKEVEGKKK